MQLTRQEHKAMCDEATELRGQVAKLQAAIDETEKKLKEAERQKDCFYACSEKRQAELNEAHSMIDLFPGAPGRQSNEDDSYRRTTYSLAARLAGWMASRPMAKL